MRNTMKWLLGIFLILGLITPKLHAFQCKTYLPKRSAKEIFSSLRNLVNMHTTSKSLTPQQRTTIQITINDLKSTADQFNQSYNSKFKPYGTVFLADLRALFQAEENNLRNKNQLLINELERFLDHGGDLIYRQLDILPHIKSIKQSWALTYLEEPNHVYFNINYYVSSHLRDGRILQGYAFSKEEHEDLKASVYVLDMKPEDQSKYIDQTFPASPIKIPRLKDSNLVFPGLPLNDQLLAFLNQHGDEHGRLRVAAIRFYPKQNSLLSSFLKTPKPLPILDIRWSTVLKRHYDLRSIDGRINISLSNLKNYYESNGRLMIPTVPVSWVEKNKTLLQRQDEQVRLHLEVSEKPELSSFTVAPTGFEFVTAFIELVQM